jgi:hypothetical protein
MRPGAALEYGIAKAAEHYTATGRAELAKQQTPRAFGGTFIAGAPVDFKGWYRDERGERPPLWLECKHTVDGRLDFTDDAGGIHFTQLDAMRDAIVRRIRSLLVVELAAPIGEVYVVDALHVVKFAAHPWRSSLSLDWLRAHGEVAKFEVEPHRRVWFLDTRPHPDRASARIRVVQERASAEGRTVELYPVKGLNKGAAATTMRELLRSKPGRDATDAEVLAWRNKFSEWQFERDVREAKRTQARAPKQRKRGGWTGGR